MQHMEEKKIVYGGMKNREVCINKTEFKSTIKLMKENKAR